MSLGFTSTWRARPLRLGPSIQWEPYFAFQRSTPFPLAALLRYSTLAKPVEALEKRDLNHKENVEEPGAFSHRKRSEHGNDGLERTKNEQTVAEIRDIEIALERSNFARSVFVPSYKELGSSSQRRHQLRAHHKAVTTQVYNDRNRVNVGGHPVDWRIVLEEMAKSTPKYSREYFEDGIKIDVEKDVLARILTSAGDDNLGALRRRTGVSIKVSRDESTLLLSGTRQAINRATEVFRNMAGRITVTRRFRPLDPGESEIEEMGYEKEFWVPPLSRDEGGYHKKQTLTQHAYLTPMPSQWTVKMVKDYVISLVDTYIAPSLHSPTYVFTPGDVLLDHERAVVRRIMRLFVRLPSEAGLSCSVVKMAMSYMTQKGNKYLPYVKGLFVLSERRGMRMDTDIFNILLRAPLKSRNLRKFRNTLKDMASRGFAPNFDTWLLFLRMFESVEVKSYILQAMNAKNMIGTPENIQRIAQVMASHDANHAAIQGKDLGTFLQEQEDRYGPDWLTRDAGNQVIHVLGQYKRYEDACRLLDLMGERYHNIPEQHIHERLATRPDAISFGTIINHARIMRKVPLAINVLRKMNTRKLARQPGLTILDHLFDLAWKKRLRATIVVIWWYASLARLTSYRMRQRVKDLLSGELGGPQDGEMTAKVYHQLGGETLAAELAGGPKALEQIRTFCRQTWGENYPRKRLARIATKTLSVAFEGYGPAVDLGEVLAQSILVDHRCLRARKSNQLKDLLASAKVKSLPMWKRQKGQELWVHLAPLNPTEPAMIKHDDEWKDEWDSAGWDVESRIGISREFSPKSEEWYRTLQAKGEEARDLEKTRVKTLEPLTEKRIAIINPNVWDDEQRNVAAMGNDHRTQLQRQNEETILKALEEVGKDIRCFRYVFDDDEDGLSMGFEGGDQRRDPLEDEESYGMDDMAEDSEKEAEDRLERLQQMIAEVTTDLQKDGTVHDYQEDTRAESEQAKE
ncbi:hypothetical protein N0V93_000509 [Gnomoniopsis smithogilvyi]|uniref:Pentatricopeptide repeat domain-containing protein n=1 Tax=Gnomoniopsis smithogilvyi TaxID=1191159 RepID=A0A9W9D1S5_9PEZI|nr:hypothetical protein N0V93_000509 [Gnomoniopsis smithogilvyi]